MKKIFSIGFVTFLMAAGSGLPAFADQGASLAEQIPEVALRATCEKYFASSRDAHWDKETATREGCFEKVTDELHRRRAAAGHSKVGEGMRACKEIGGYFAGEAWRLSREAKVEHDQGRYPAAKAKSALAQEYLKLARSELLVKAAENCMPVAAFSEKPLDTSASCRVEPREKATAERAL